MTKIHDTGMLLPGAPKLRAKSMIESGSLEALWDNIADSLGLSESQLPHMEYEQGDTTSHLLDEWKQGLSKNKLWPAPDYSSLLEAGIPWQVIKTLKDIRDCYPAQAIRPYPAHLKAYATSIQAGKQLADHMLNHWVGYQGVGSGTPSMEKIILVASLMIKYDHPYIEHEQYPPPWLELEATESEQAEIKKFLIVSDVQKELAMEAIESLKSYMRLEGARGMASDAFRTYSRARKHSFRLDRVLDQRPYYRAHQELTLMGLKKAPRTGDLSPQGLESCYGIFRRLKIKSRTVLPAVEKSTETPTDTGTSKKPRRPIRLSAEEAKEAIANSVRNANQSLEKLVEMGIARGVQIGEWVTQKERPALVAATTQAFESLAEANAVPQPLLGLGRPLTSEQQQESRDNGLISDAYKPGSALGIALGARGSSRAAAHYEPGLHVINLTRFNGAGSLAHEWGHALDATLTHELVSLSKVNHQYHHKDISRITGAGNNRISSVSEWMAVFWHIHTLKATRGELRDNYDQQLRHEINRCIKPESNTLEARQLLFSVGKLFEGMYCKKRSLDEMLDTVRHQCALKIADTARRFDTVFREEAAQLNIPYDPAKFVIGQDHITVNGLYMLFKATQNAAVSGFEDQHDRDLTAESRANFENALLNSYQSGAFAISVFQTAKELCLDEHPDVDLESEAPAQKEQAAQLLQSSIVRVITELPSEQITRFMSYVCSAHRGWQDIQHECMKGFSMSDMQQRSGANPLRLATTDPSLSPVRKRCSMVAINSQDMEDLEKGAFLMEGLKAASNKKATGFNPFLLEALEDTGSAFTTAILEQLMSRANAVLERYEKTLAGLSQDDHPLIRSLVSYDIDIIAGGVFAQHYLDLKPGQKRISELLASAAAPAWLKKHSDYQMLESTLCDRTADMDEQSYRTAGMGEQTFGAAVLKQISRLSKWDTQERVDALVKSKGKRVFPLTPLMDLIGRPTVDTAAQSCVFELEAMAASESSTFRYLTHGERVDLIGGSVAQLKGHEHLLDAKAMQHFYTTGSLSDYDDSAPDMARSIAESIITANQDLNQQRDVAYKRLSYLRGNIQFKTTCMRIISELVLNSAAFESAQMSPGGEAAAKNRNYWSTSKEIFARAFETCVHDCLDQKGMPDPYLVSLPSKKAQAALSRPSGDGPMLRRTDQRKNVHYVHCYPMGVEREQLLSNFQKLTPDLAPLLAQRFPEAMALQEYEKEKQRYAALHDDAPMADLNQLKHSTMASIPHDSARVEREHDAAERENDQIDAFTAPAV